MSAQDRARNSIAGRLPEAEHRIKRALEVLQSAVEHEARLRVELALFDEAEKMRAVTLITERKTDDVE